MFINTAFRHTLALLNLVCCDVFPLLTTEANKVILPFHEQPCYSGPCNTKGFHCLLVLIFIDFIYESFRLGNPDATYLHLWNSGYTNHTLTFQKKKLFYKITWLYFLLIHRRKTHLVWWLYIKYKIGRNKSECCEVTTSVMVSTK